MLWSGNDYLVCIAITDSEHPRPAALTDNGSGLSVEPAVRHSLLDAWLNDNVNPVADLEPLDNGGYRRQTPLA
jgi:hypothetical protein